MDLEARMLAFMSERLDRMGPDESGLYAYYSDRVRKAEPVRLYERVLADRLVGSDRVVHVGTGLGILPALLASRGVPAVGLEKDARRFAAAEAMREYLGLDYDLRLAAFPEGVEPGGALVFTNLALKWTDEQTSEMVRKFKGFDPVFLDLATFGRHRLGEEQEALAALLPGEVTPVRIPGWRYVSCVQTPG